jgi:hypothetical protein
MVAFPAVSGLRWQQAAHGARSPSIYKFAAKFENISPVVSGSLFFCESNSFLAIRDKEKLDQLISIIQRELIG